MRERKANRLMARENPSPAPGWPQFAHSLTGRTHCPRLEPDAMNAATAKSANRGKAAFADATRVLTSVLAPLEKRVLVAMARRIPARINSDHLTGLALVAMLGAGASYWLASVTRIGLFLAVVCLALNWLGDSLDGTLARVRNHQRPRYGFYVDHVVDALGALLLFAGLGLS